MTFNLSSHVAGTVLILLFSAFGAGFPTILASHEGLTDKLDGFFSFAKTLSAGILLSTAFVHLLPPAFASLQTSPSLGHWSEAMAGIITLFIILLMQLTEYLFVEKLSASEEQHDHHHDHSPRPPHSPTRPPNYGTTTQPESKSYTAFANKHALIRRESLLFRSTTNPVISKDECHHGHQEDCSGPTCGHDHLLHLASKKQKLSTYVLLVGIISHSIIIGLTLGVTSDSQFVPLLIALCLHQCFEGFGLGVKLIEAHEQVADENAPLLSGETRINWKRLYILVALFVLATPIGASIGIYLRLHLKSVFDSPTSKIIQGSLDSASAGILIFVAMNSLNNESDFGHQGSTREKIVRFFGLWFGAVLMAILGKWV